MVRVKEESYDHADAKSHLAIETFQIYQNANYNHNHKSHSKPNSPFIDWYLILRVEEDACIDTIRKQYLKLALLLHPDKNKHPKAEFSFKLISQAYKCLSDADRRKSFNSERLRNLSACQRTPQHSSPFHPKNPKHKPTKLPSPNSKSQKILQQLRVIRQQLMEDSRVIQSCMKLNMNRGGPNNDECPVFYPKTYAHLGYPHHRRHNIPNHLFNVYRKNPKFSGDDHATSGRCETPVFQIRTDCCPLNVKNSSASVTS